MTSNEWLAVIILILILKGCSNSTKRSTRLERFHRPTTPRPNTTPVGIGKRRS